MDSDLPDPSSVILFGHSMGGIVARTMLIMPNYQSNSINTIITMSAPHARPPAPFDKQIVETYDDINNYWRKSFSAKWANNNPLWHVTLVSIAGGGLDTIVPSDYASISSLVPDTHGFTVFTSSIPNVWVGVDHLAILWCDQLMKVVARSMLDIVDVKRPGQTKPRAERMRIFKKWYLTGMEPIAEKTLPHKGLISMPFSTGLYQLLMMLDPTTLLTLDNSHSIVNLGQRLVLRQLGESQKPRAYLMPLSVPPSLPLPLSPSLPFPPSMFGGMIQFNFFYRCMPSAARGGGGVSCSYPLHLALLPSSSLLVLSALHLTTNNTTVFPYSLSFRLGFGSVQIEEKEEEEEEEEEEER
ncbi:PGAP1-domain-containing protein [Tuber magnatum]|uniref:GPI inositol-deacylase n=1 Tax=Tuber magnatum TaxID=42249 RepID=A0A317SF20_9PEZI|nr:PGAP1-domain-containing protein [Tuber magnatum]